MIRAFMRSAFPKLLDILFVIGAAGVLLVAFSALAAAGFLSFLSTLIGGGISLILGFGVVYLLLDIRDGLTPQKPL